MYFIRNFFKEWFIMSLLDKIIGEFSYYFIECFEDEATLFNLEISRYQNEIKNNAKLTVREGQVAIFVNEGKVADVFQPEWLPNTKTCLSYPH